MAKKGNTPALSGRPRASASCRGTYPGFSPELSRHHLCARTYIENFAHRLQHASLREARRSVLPKVPDLRVRRDPAEAA
jgi:hypothetical protein